MLISIINRVKELWVVKLIYFKVCDSESSDKHKYSNFSSLLVYFIVT